MHAWKKIGREEDKMRGKGEGACVCRGRGVHLHLVEGRVVRRVDFVAPINVARAQELCAVIRLGA